MTRTEKEHASSGLPCQNLYGGMRGQPWRHLIFFAIFILKCVLICSAALIPGLVIRTYMGNRLRLGFVPVPGIVFLAVAGAIEWAAPEWLAQGVNWIVIALLLAGLVVALREHRQLRTLAGCGGGAALLILAMVFSQAVAVGINPLPVAQEVGAGGPIPGRMIASPPDHAIPYRTAAYMARGLDGTEESAAYFGSWGITARGPIIPLGINALFHIFSVDVTTSFIPAMWPVSRSGEDIARIYGWLTNALVILGAMELLHSLRVPMKPMMICLAWLALSPVVAINTVFLWPKLAATYFFLLAIAQLVHERRATAGALTALAWLCHPVGALMIPALGLFLLFGPSGKTVQLFDIKPHAKKAMPFLASLFGVMAPWLMYKVYLWQPDHFAAYIFGYGAGLRPAPSFSVWLQCRLDNVWYTLAPGAFFAHGFMASWLYGPLSDTLRWSIGYAKSIPGHLGLSCFLLSYLALARAPKEHVLRGAWLWLLLANFAVTVIFWGFSNDGMGRNALGPLSVLLIVFTVARLPWSARFLPFLFPVLAAETQWLQLSGFFANPDFRASELSAPSIGCLMASFAISFSLVSIAWRSPLKIDAAN